MNPDEQVNPSVDIMLDAFITPDDIYLYLFMIVVLVATTWLMGRLVLFIPSLMADIIKKIKNKSVIYSNDTLENSNLGLKDMFEKVFK